MARSPAAAVTTRVGAEALVAGWAAAKPCTAPRRSAVSRRRPLDQTSIRAVAAAWFRTAHRVAEVPISGSSPRRAIASPVVRISRETEATSIVRVLAAVANAGPEPTVSRIGEIVPVPAGVENNGRAIGRMFPTGPEGGEAANAGPATAAF